MTTENINQDDYNYLCKNYDWFQKRFPDVIQKACDEFFLEGFKLSLLGISKNINVLMAKESYFVTKIRLDKFRDIFFRASEDTIGILLNKILGRSPRAFNLNRLTDLEAKIITSFNDFLFNSLKDNINEAPPTVKRTNFDVIHMTFLLRDMDMDKAGKFIITIPEELISPEPVEPDGEKFGNDYFSKSTIDVKIRVGTTKFSVFDLKALDEEDIVVFEKSNSKNLTLIFKDYTKTININPNLGLVLPVDNEEGEKMGADNLWDSIEVEMDAQFDSVKITLGELKKIQEGIVVDLSTIYDSKVTLSVEDKAIAKGDLVIVNDRYGVKVTEVFAKGSGSTETDEAEMHYDDSDEDFSPIAGNDNDFSDAPSVGSGDEEDEFDYSDFELEDEDI